MGVERTKKASGCKAGNWHEPEEYERVVPNQLDNTAVPRGVANDP